MDNCFKRALLRLDKEQRQAVTVGLNQPTAVLAGPGSGKTTVIAHRYAYLVSELGIAANNILAVTFSKEMAKEMAGRIKLVSPTSEAFYISTIHAACYRFLRDQLNDSRRKADEWAIKRCIIESQRRLGWGDNWQYLRWWIDRSKQDGISQDDRGGLTQYYREVHGFDFRIASGLSFACDHLRRCLNDQSQLTYSDMINDMWQGLQSPTALAKARKIYKYILVDEAQDTGKLPLSIVRLIAGDNLFVVGDADQTLYRFSGAAPEHNLFTFDNTLKLQTNYRSTKKLAKPAGRLIKNNYDLVNQHLMKTMSCVKKSSSLVSYRAFDTPEEEAEWVATTIKKLNLEPASIFVGARTNAYLAFFERAMQQREIPYVIASSRSFADRRHVRVVASYVQLVQDFTQDEAFKVVYNVASKFMVNHQGRYQSHRYLGEAFLEDCRRTCEPCLWSAMLSLRNVPKYADGIRDLIMFVEHLDEQKSRGIKVLVDTVIENCYIPYHLSGQQDTIAVDPSDSVLADLDALSIMASKSSSIDDFLKTLTNMRKSAKSARRRAKSVVLSTVHKLKGLERDIVFGVGWSEGILPHKAVLVPIRPDELSPLNESRLSDERCIAYVLATRAKRALLLSSVRLWKDEELAPSRFLCEMGLLDAPITVSEDASILEQGEKTFIWQPSRPTL